MRSTFLELNYRQEHPVLNQCLLKLYFSLFSLYVRTVTKIHVLKGGFHGSAHVSKSAHFLRLYQCLYHLKTPPAIVSRP